MPVGIVFSLDYEIHGNGEGSPMGLMVEPTARLLQQLEQFGARLTIFAEVAEIIRFQQHFAAGRRDDFDSGAIATQLRDALARGHDVQLHVHPSYLGAVLGPGGWEQNWEEYDTAQLPPPRVQEVIAQAKTFLEDLLRPVQAEYKVYAFRAGNWAMMPTRHVAEALVEHGIEIDSSVFKGGRRDGLVRFDYTNVPSPAAPWRVDLNNICSEDPASPLWEYPIYSEMRRMIAFLTTNRLYRLYQSRTHRFSVAQGGTASDGSKSGGARWLPLSKAAADLFGKHAWKADFNQCSGRQLIRSLQRVEREHARDDVITPFVTIGHSKLFNSHNEKTLEPFLAFASRRPDRFRFCLYSDFLERAAKQT